MDDFLNQLDDQFQEKLDQSDDDEEKDIAAANNPVQNDQVQPAVEQNKPTEAQKNEKKTEVVPCKHNQVYGDP